MSRWCADATGESDAERARRAVTHSFGDLGYANSLPAQQVLRQRHAPTQQILHRRDPDLTPEPVKERRSRKCRPLCKLHHRPVLPGAFVHFPQREGESVVAKPAQKARWRRGPRGRAQGLDQQNLKQACQYHVATGPVRPHLVVHEFDQCGQPPIAANMDELGQERYQQTGIVRAERAMTHEHSDVRRIAGSAEPEHARTQLCCLQLHAPGRWLKARGDEIIGCGNKDEVAAFERDRLPTKN